MDNGTAARVSKMLELQKELINVELSRLGEAKDYSVDEVVEMMERAIKCGQGLPAHEKKIALTEVYPKLLLGQRQIDNEDMVGNEEVFGMLRNKYGY